MTPSKETTDYISCFLDLYPDKKILILKRGEVVFPTDIVKTIFIKLILTRIKPGSDLSFFENKWYKVEKASSPAIGDTAIITDITKDMAKKIGLPDGEVTEGLMAGYLKSLENHPQGFSLIMLDVDHFKAINDTYGHLVGDDVLRVIAKAVKASVRSTDIVGRYGGDEIFLLLPNILLENIIMKINMIMGKAQNPETFLLDIPSLQSPPTLSIGAVQITASEVVDLMASVAAFEPTERYSALLKTLIDKADRAMYQSKGNGRNRATIVDISGNVISVLEPEQLQTLSYKRRTTDAV